MPIGVPGLVSYFSRSTNMNVFWCPPSSWISICSVRFSASSTSMPLYRFSHHKRELVPEVRSRRPDPPVTLPLPLGAHVFDRNAVPAQLPRVVRVRVVPPRQTARLEHQVRRVRVQVEHLHSLDAQRAAEVNGEDDKRTFVFAEDVLLDLPKLPSLFDVILARLELDRPRLGPTRPRRTRGPS